MIFFQDKNGETVLHYAVRYGSPQIIQLLVSRGATTLKANKEGKLSFQLCSDSDTRWTFLQNFWLTKTILYGYFLKMGIFSVFLYIPYFRTYNILKQQMLRENLMKCSFCQEQSQVGTKRCSRCHHARYIFYIFFS